MADSPVVTVTDPAVPVCGREMLGSGGPRRVRPALVALGCLAVLAALGVQQVRAHRTEAAAFAAADRVNVGVSLLLLQPAGTMGSLRAVVRVRDDGTRQTPVRVTGMALEGHGMRSTGGYTRVPLGDTASPQYIGLAGEARADCAAVARQGMPVRASVRVRVVPRSGLAHDVRLPIPSARLREQLLVTCGLPDP